MIIEGACRYLVKDRMDGVFPGPVGIGIVLDAQRAAFVGYALIALAALWCYRGLDPSNDAPPPRAATAPLARPRGIVLRLSLLFSLDLAGGGLAVQALLALWLIRRFGLDPETLAAIFFGTGVLSGVSQLASPYIAARIGLIRTMVFTHLPANVFLILAAFMPTAPLTILMLLLRTSLSQMDVPARQA
jgi:predicted MFS family arabinose efflux permease